MGRRGYVLVLVVLAGSLLLPVAGRAADDDLDALFDDDDYLADEVEVNDPLEPMNRFFFAFNDKIYYWLVRPVARGYSVVFPEDVRYSFDRAFENIRMPVRLVNNLLQGKFRGGLREVGRFLINSTIGVAGLADPAATEFGLAASDEDFGQTLGRYGVGEGIYIYLPLIGPSTARDSVGLAGDYMVSPLRYLLRNETSLGVASWGWWLENSISLHGDVIDDLRDQAFDPYVAFRDFYLQHRRSLLDDSLDEKADGRGARRDCRGRQPARAFFNLAEARTVMSCAEEQGLSTRLTRTRRGNRIVYGGVVEKF